MARKYDIENLADDIKTLLAANLNTYTAAVEAEQVAAGMPAAPPPTIDADGYFLFAWNDQALNKAAGVGIFPQEAPSQGEGPYGARKIIVDVGMYICGTQNDPLAARKLLRTGKAMAQLFSEKWGKINSCVTREKIETVGPIDFKFNVDSSDDCKIAGVTLSVTLG